MIKFLVVEHDPPWKDADTVTIATKDTYEEAVKIIEMVDRGVFSIEKRWYVPR